MDINPDAGDIAGEMAMAAIQEVDEALRSQVAGEPLDVVKPRAEAALSSIGLVLPDSDLTAYAQSIADGQDFQFNLSV